MNVDELDVLKKMIEKNIENVENNVLASFDNIDIQNSTQGTKSISSHKSKRVLY